MYMLCVYKNKYLYLIYIVKSICDCSYFGRSASKVTCKLYHVICNLKYN